MSEGTASQDEQVKEAVPGGMASQDEQVKEAVPGGKASEDEQVKKAVPGGMASEDEQVPAQEERNLCIIRYRGWYQGNISAGGLIFGISS